MFIDDGVFTPFAPSNSKMSLNKCFLKHEKEKKRACEQCVRDVDTVWQNPAMADMPNFFVY